MLQLLSQRVGSARSSVAEYYVQTSNQPLWEHMQQYSLRNMEEGVHRLRLVVNICTSPSEKSGRW
jgi:hypothetical protein